MTEMLASPPTILLRAGIDDARARVGEFCQLDTILLAQQALVVPAVLNVVDLYGVVALGCHAQLARVVEVDGEDMRLGLALLNVVPSE
jgi:hypothetical protein